MVSKKRFWNFDQCIHEKLLGNVVLMVKKFHFIFFKLNLPPVFVNTYSMSPSSPMLVDTVGRPRLRLRDLITSLDMPP